MYSTEDGLEYDEWRDQQLFEGNPLIEQENRAEAMVRTIHKIEGGELAKKRWAEDLKIDRLPYWLHPEADYLPIDAGNWPEEE